MILAPHVDDEVLGTGGVIARHVARGDQVHVAFFCRATSNMAPEPLVEQGLAEARAIHQMLRVTGTFWPEFSAAMLDTVPLSRLIDHTETLIRSVQPDIIYAPHGGDPHQDHQLVFRAALVATRPDRNRVSRFLCYETVSETEWAVPEPHMTFAPTVFVDISEYLPTKLKAASMYTFQIMEEPHPRSVQQLDRLARLRGSIVMCKAAEAFMLVREIES